MLDNPAALYSSLGQVCPCTLTPLVHGLISLAETGILAEVVLLPRLLSPLL